MFRWILVIFGLAVAWSVIRTLRDVMRSNRLATIQRNRTKCPRCNANIGSMFDSADAKALAAIKEEIANAPKDMRVNPAGHPVELACIHCGTTLCFQVDDGVTTTQFVNSDSNANAK